MTPTLLSLEEFRLSDETVNGMILSSRLRGNKSQGPLRESFGEELPAACTTAIISGPRYGNTVGSSLVISTNSSVWTTRLDHAYEDNTRPTSQYSQNGRKKVYTSEASPNKNPDNVFPSREYLSNPRVIPSEHDNATLGTVREQWQVPPGLFVVCPDPQIPNNRSGHVPINSPAPGYSDYGPPHCF